MKKINFLMMAVSVGASLNVSHAARTKKTKASTIDNVQKPAMRRTTRPMGVASESIRVLIEDKKFDQALSMLGSSNDPNARALRALIFERMGYDHAALIEHVANYRSRPNLETLSKIGVLSFVLGESRLIQGVSGESMGMRLALSQEALLAGDLNKARSLLPSPQSILNLEPSVFKSKAIVLASAISSASGNYRDALEVLSGNFSQTAGVDLSEIRLQRALVLFEVKKYSEALDELKFVTRASPAWYRGQLVGAWSAFHKEDYNLSLGQLMNLRSPFLAGKFNPEKHLLQAIVLFQLCHYEMAGRALKKLKEEYGNLNSAFATVSSATGNPASFYKQLKSFAGKVMKEETSSLDRVWDGIASQPYVATVSSSIEKLRFERRKIDGDFRSRELQGIRGVHLKVFDRMEEVYLSKLAKYSQASVEKMRSDAKESLEGALAADLEINTKIRDRLIRAAGPVNKSIDFKKELQRGYEFWPFEGEFWRDETGGYAFATTDVCEEGAR
jgi:tetratricopeptide (TPR) repeat protein